MSEEEKKAIIELNHYINITAYWKQEEYTNNEIDNYIKILLSLIEKQQKEIEHLKREKEVDYISKEKIREIMKHYQKLYKEDNSPNQFLMEQTYLSKLSLLYDLLEE